MEILIVMVIVMIVFGVGKLPEIGGGLGRGMRDFKKGIEDPDDKSKDATPKS
jgi:sec-independent protein translocase protein TatA